MLRTIKRFLFENTTIRQTVAKNVFWLSISNFGGRLLRAAIIIYAARILGTAEWGIFSYAISLVTFLTVFVDAGVSQLLVREFSKLDDPARQQKIISTSFLLKAALICIGVLVIVLLGPFITNIDGVKIILPIAALIFAFDNMREFGFSIVRACEKMQLETGLYMLTNLAIVIFGFIFLQGSATVGAFTFAYALGTGIGMAATLYTVREKLRGIFSNFEFLILRSILVSGWPLAISAVLGMLMINTDILLIGFFQSAHDVGLYSAAQRIVQLLYIVPAIITVSLLPSFSRLANNENEKLRRILEIVVPFTFLIAIPIAVGGMLLGSQIMEFVFGNSYLGSASSFQILLTTILIDFPVVILANVAFAYGKQKKLMMYAGIGGLSNIILDLILIPRFGILGSAWATLFAQVLSVAYLWKVVRGVSKPKVLPYLKKIVMATGIMAIAVMLVTLAGAHVIASIFAGAVVYAGMLFLLKEPLLREIRNLASA
ncbi:MAG: flippase [Patescibacteria group bacterium]